MVLDIAGGDALGVGFLHEGRGVRLEHPGDGALGQRVPVARAVGHASVVVPDSDLDGVGSSHFSLPENEF